MTEDNQVASYAAPTPCPVLEYHGTSQSCPVLKCAHGGTSSARTTEQPTGSTLPTPGIPNSLLRRDLAG
eukprot:710862-Rhodomonas_salina.2